jgi:hypothetical protein
MIHFHKIAIKKTGLQGPVFQVTGFPGFISFSFSFWIWLSVSVLLLRQFLLQSVSPVPEHYGKTCCRKKNFRRLKKPYVRHVPQTHEPFSAHDYAMPEVSARQQR